MYNKLMPSSAWQPDLHPDCWVAYIRFQQDLVCAKQPKMTSAVRKMLRRNYTVIHTIWLIQTLNQSLIFRQKRGGVEKSGLVGYTSAQPDDVTIWVAGVYKGILWLCTCIVDPKKQASCYWHAQMNGKKITKPKRLKTCLKIINWKLSSQKFRPSH